MKDFRLQYFNLFNLGFEIDEKGITLKEEIRRAINDDASYALKISKISKIQKMEISNNFFNEIKGSFYANFIFWIYWRFESNLFYEYDIKYC